MSERRLHLPTESSGECSACWQAWPCDVAIAWEQAHALFCPRGGAGKGDVCSTHLRPGDRYAHAQLAATTLAAPSPSEPA